MASKPQILFIDAYDSFSNNIIALLESELGTRVTKIYNDAKFADFSSFLDSFAAIVCGPGPGHPSNADEVGLIRDVWRLTPRDTVPILGICLGFQSLVVEFGGVMKRLHQPRHGIETRVLSQSSSIFKGLPIVRAVQYHSLHATLGHGPSTLECVSLWEPSTDCPELLPLAWDFSIESERSFEFQKNPDGILMAVKHVEKPFYGIQFHPESICSQAEARSVVVNWWRAANDWLRRYNPGKLAKVAPVGVNELVEGRSDRVNEGGRIDSLDQGNSGQFEPLSSSSSNASSAASSAASFLVPKPSSVPLGKVLELENLTIPLICEFLDLRNDQIIILDSEMRQIPLLGESSIIAVVNSTTKKLKYAVGAKHAILEQGNHETCIDLDPHDGNFLNYIKSFMADQMIISDSDSAFCGGLVGYLTYEACLETIGVPATSRRGRPDICFAFVERSVVIDHQRKLAYVQSLRYDDDPSEHSWVSKAYDILKSVALHGETSNPCEVQPSSETEGIRCSIPFESQYRAKIRECQEHIRAGNSYELCLTDQAAVQEDCAVDVRIPSWDRYLQLRRLNPAPFAAYIKLGPLTLLSTSPERFMCWSRFGSNCAMSRKNESRLVSTVQFRPIKGTLKKMQMTTDGQVQCLTREQATAHLSVQKEQAENLMIVDLIRHDLNGVVKSGDVNVKGLMVVEEYESVYQLVSVIEANLFKPSPVAPSPLHFSLCPSSPRHLSKSIKTGIDVFAASLPPGSMTGAPKRRSCQLLHEIEGGKPRSVYSGVLGYMCVTGKGDFSVVIRSAFKWDNPDGEGEEGEQWRIGAGGAITSLSTQEGEWEEMLTKLHSTLGVFAPKI